MSAAPFPTGAPVGGQIHHNHKTPVKSNTLAFSHTALVKSRSIVDGLFAPDTNKLATGRMQALYAWAGYKDPVVWETKGN